jgi:ornithine cyclodeaminase/alanine dehydrogenase-like protein (mu-crystallin family)
MPHPLPFLFVELLVLNHDEVTSLLPMRACVDLMRATLTSLAEGDGLQPLRSVVMVPGLPGFLGLMPGYAGGGRPALGMKFLGIFPGNPKQGKDAHQGLVMLLDPGTGEPRAILDASAITAIRTAAVTAVATDALARPDAKVLAIFGRGVQGRAHARALALVRPLAEIRVVGRDGDAAAALEGADIVVTATSSATPVLRREWLSPGTHVNAVGSCVPRDRELDTETVAASRFFVDRRESALNESGDYLIAAREAGLGEAHIVAELGEVLTGASAGRTSPSELTVFKSLGLAVQDLAAAAHAVEAADAAGLGTRVRF